MCENECLYMSGSSLLVLVVDGIGKSRGKGTRLDKVRGRSCQIVRSIYQAILHTSVCNRVPAERDPIKGDWDPLSEYSHYHFWRRKRAVN